MSGPKEEWIDYYELLEVSPKARTAVIEGAFKRLSLVYHPDRGGDPKFMQLLIEARDVLCDPEKRRKYDSRYRARMKNHMSTSSPPTEPETEPAPQPSPLRLPRIRAPWIVVGVVTLLTLAAAIFGGIYFFNSRDFIATDNAQIDGDRISINAPVSGTLLDWTANLGAAVHIGDVVGRIQLEGRGAQSSVPIHAPGDGTVALDNGLIGTFVTTGTTLAVAYNLDRIYITARVDETDVKAVRVGQPVDIYVDAFPTTTLHGRVQEIQGGAASVFSLFPQNNSSTGGDLQKGSGIIPVKIALDSTPGVDLVPGMNVTVHIHKH